MVFIIGGVCQGKSAFAKKNFKDGYHIINTYHLTVKSQLKENRKPIDEAIKLIETAKADGSFEKLVIISDELGYGLVPIDAFERDYRETNGRVNCYFAKEANQVFRVVCGIADRIK